MNDNFKCIYTILRTLEKALDYPEFDIEQIGHIALGISKERWTAYIEMLCDAGYIKGVVVQKYIDGEKNVDVDDIMITLKGLEFLTENSIMQRTYKTAKGIKDISPKIRV